MSLPIYDAQLVRSLIASHAHLTGRALVPADVRREDAARWLYEDAHFAVLAHDAGDDPRFVYANCFAQRCFERSWSELVGLPSRLSAEAPAQAERAAMLARVATHGYADGYRGVRLAKSGRRFWIEDGCIWNVLDTTGVRIGQAASFAQTAPV